MQAWQTERENNREKHLEKVKWLQITCDICNGDNNAEQEIMQLLVLPSSYQFDGGVRNGGCQVQHHLAHLIQEGAHRSLTIKN
jgi:hypothetical protein